MIDPDHPENRRRIAELPPTGRFPALVDGERTVTQSNAMIEYLDLRHANAPPMAPENREEALDARMMAGVFDDHVHVPMQRIARSPSPLVGEGAPKGRMRGIGRSERVAEEC